MKYLFAFVFLHFNILCYSQSVYTHLQTEDGLPSNMMFDCMEDNQGFMWFSSNKGVARYNGSDWLYLNATNGLPDNDVLTIMEDSKGRIWFVSYSGELSYYYQDKLFTKENDTLLNKLPSFNAIASLYEAPNGDLWVNPIKDYFYKIAKDTVIQYIPDGDVKKKKAIAFNYNGNPTYFGMIVNQTFTDGEFKWNGTIPKVYNVRNYYLDTSLGKMVYLTYEGIVQIYEDKPDLELLVPAQFLVEHKNIGSLYLKDNMLWVCTINDGVYLYDKFLEGDYSAKHILKNKTIGAIEIDQRGNKWFTSLRNGVYMIPYDYSFQSKVFHLTVDDDQISCFNYDEKGDLWVGTNYGYIYNYSKPNEPLISISTKLKTLSYINSHNTIIDLVFIKSKLIIYSVNAILIYDLNKEELSYISSGHHHYAAKDICVQGDTLTASFTNGLFIYDIASSEEQFSVAYNKSVYSHERLADGIIYYANKEGLYKYAENKHELVLSSEQISKQRIYNIKQLPNNNKLLLSTNGDGLYTVDLIDMNLRPINKKDGLHSNYVKGVEIDSSTIWTHSTQGIDKIEYTEDSIETINSYPIQRGNKYSKIVDVKLYQDSLFLAINNAIVYYDVEQIVDYNRPPTCYINNVSSLDSALNMHHAITLTKPYNTITIDCGLIDYNQSFNRYYRYRLKGQNDEWKGTQSTYFEFAELKEGNYTFEFKSSYDGLLWSTPVAIQFKVIYPFWDRFWVKSSYSTLFILVLLGFIYIGVKKRHIKNVHRLNQHLRVKSLEQKALQSMMNPHFIFNVLNSIKHALRYESKQEAQESLTDFAALIRTNLEVNQHKFISIDEEIDYLKLYLSMEKKRFDQPFEYSIEVHPEIDSFDTIIPTMLIQPFVENAIWHGLIPQGGGKLIISFDVHKLGLQISVFDNGIGVGTEKTNSAHNSLGIKLTRERFEIMKEIYQREFSVSIKNREHQETDKSGTEIAIIIPDDLFELTHT